MVNGKGTSKPYIHFIGNSTIDVTGSMHHIRFKKYSLLLDCGMIQGADIVSNYQANKAQIKAVRPQDIDYIILSHPHIDHIGLVPALFAKGCHAHIYAVEGLIPFLKLLWEDSLKIMTSDCLKIEAKHGRKAAPYYTQDDIGKALMRVIEVPYNQPYALNDSMQFTYYPAGHIINSAQIYLEMTEGYTTKRIGFTGDIGGSIERPYTPIRKPLPFVDVLIGENTYNTPARVNNIKDRPKDIEKIRSIVSEYNKILIPCFSLQRTQEMLKLLTEMNLDCPIILDSPLAYKFCQMWNDEWAGVKYIETWEQSQALQYSNEHCIILSASGFLQGGRIMAHLKTALSNPNNHLIFIGYAGENNLASQIKSGQKEVIIDGDVVKNKANITELRSFSSHASYEELLEYYSVCRYNKLCLVHGNFADKVTFTHTLQERLISQGKSSRAIATAEGQKIYI